MGLQSLENGLGRIVDGVFNRAFKNNVRPIEIGRRLIREIDTQRAVDSKGQRVVPNDYTISLSTPDFEALHPYLEPLKAELVHAAEQYCADEGYTLKAPVCVAVIEDAQTPRRRINITGDFTSRSATVAQPPAPATPPTLVQATVQQTETSSSTTITATLVISDGREVALGDAPVVIGRLGECDITIEDPNISRRHATVTALDGGFRITDLGSTNGTKVNGSRIASQFELSHGDEITVGLFSIRFEIR